MLRHLSFFYFTIPNYRHDICMNKHLRTIIHGLDSSKSRKAARMSRIFNLIYIVLLVVAAPWLIYRSWKTGKYRDGWGEKFLGRCPERVGRGECIWFHAVSVGEVRLLQPLVAELQRRRPDWDIVISSTTETGLAQARQLFPELLTFFALWISVGPRVGQSQGSGRQHWLWLSWSCGPT